VKTIKTRKTIRPVLKSFHFLAGLAACAFILGAGCPAKADTLSVDFDQELGKVVPLSGFLHGRNLYLDQVFPDALVDPLNPTMWRIGFQFRGKTPQLLEAIDYIGKHGAKCKLCFGDLVESHPPEGKDWSGFDWAAYEKEVKALVTAVGDRAESMIWEPQNEPDMLKFPIESDYLLYSHAFKALREANKNLQICGPGFAFPSYEKYRAFLNYCRSNQLECNYLSFHSTGWNPDRPEKEKQNLGRLREFVKDYPEQKIREIDCDEWGGPTDEPGRLQPGRAIVWFYYLENVYSVDHACRANYGWEDDPLGGTVTRSGQTYPVYYAHRWYAGAKGQIRVRTSGNTKDLACLASKSINRREVVVGSIRRGTCALTLALKDATLKGYAVSVKRLPGRFLEEPLAAADIPVDNDFRVEKQSDGVTLTLPKVQENEAYQLVFTR